MSLKSGMCLHCSRRSSEPEAIVAVSIVQSGHVDVRAKGVLAKTVRVVVELVAVVLSEMLIKKR